MQYFIYCYIYYNIYGIIMIKLIIVRFGTISTVISLSTHFMKNIDTYIRI